MKRRKSFAKIKQLCFRRGKVESKEVFYPSLRIIFKLYKDFLYFKPLFFSFYPSI